MSDCSVAKTYAAHSAAELGKTVRQGTAKRTMSAIQNGRTPRKIVVIGMSRRTERRTKTFNPIGGEIRLISVTTTTMFPNQIVTAASVAGLVDPKSSDRTKG